MFTIVIKEKEIMGLIQLIKKAQKTIKKFKATRHCYIRYSLGAIKVLAQSGFLNRSNNTKKANKAGFLSFIYPTNTPVVQQKSAGNQKSSWWDCMRRTAGRQISTTMVSGALLGLRGGIKSMALGAVGGILGGTFWAGVDCSK